MLYMQGELQSRQIAEKVGVSPVTMSKWSKEGNWEMAAGGRHHHAGGTDTQSLHADSGNEQGHSRAW